MAALGSPDRTAGIPSELSPGLAAAELWISTLLRWGVLTSVAVIAVGIALTFGHHPDYFSSQESLSRLTRRDGPHSLSEVLAGIYAIKGQAVVMGGLLMLISLPVTRVAMSLWLFFRLRDRAFVAITFAVLSILVLSFSLGKGL